MIFTSTLLFLHMPRAYTPLTPLLLKPPRSIASKKVSSASSVDHRLCARFLLLLFFFFFFDLDRDFRFSVGGGSWHARSASSAFVRMPSSGAFGPGASSLETSDVCTASSFVQVFLNRSPVSNQNRLKLGCEI